MRVPLANGRPHAHVANGSSRRLQWRSLLEAVSTKLLRWGGLHSILSYKYLPQYEILGLWTISFFMMTLELGTCHLLFKQSIRSSQLEYSTFWAVTQRWKVVWCQRFWNSYWSHLHRLNDERRMPGNRWVTSYMTGVGGDRFATARTKTSWRWDQ